MYSDPDFKLQCKITWEHVIWGGIQIGTGWGSY